MDPVLLLALVEPGVWTRRPTRCLQRSLLTSAILWLCGYQTRIGNSLPKAVAESNGDVRRSWGCSPFSSLGLRSWFYFNMHVCFLSYRPDIMSAISSQCLNFQLETERFKTGCLFSWSLRPLLPWGDLTGMREVLSKSPRFCSHHAEGLYSFSLCFLSIPCAFPLTWKKMVRQN